jgi:hypothetical protein
MDYMYIYPHRNVETECSWWYSISSLNHEHTSFDYQKKVYLATKIIADYLSLRANKVEATWPWKNSYSCSPQQHLGLLRPAYEKGINSTHNYNSLEIKKCQDLHAPIGSMSP